MCGVAGIFNRKGPINPVDMEKMLNTIRHRGPDDSGMVCFQSKKQTYHSLTRVNGNVLSPSENFDIILGHVRLSIIDLSTAGHQPMGSSDGRTWITFNGEIFNYKQIRSQLEKLGYIFKSKTDTEVLLYAYKEYGESCLEKLRGFFAFCIYDMEKKKLFIARDRLGLKPLKYYWDGASFAFASELKALLQLPWITREADPTAIDQYLTLRYVLPPLTGIKGVKKLPAGCCLTINLDNPSNGPIIRRYWLPEFRPKTNLSYEEAVEQSKKLLEESINIRLMSDVPLGIFLSGGIDSSAIVALLRNSFDGEIHTISVGFSDKQFDERHYARMVAELYGTNHTELAVELNPDEDLQKIVWHFDEPFGDPSAIPSFYLAKAASNHVKVILNGDGGDELLAGYKRYSIHNRNRFLDYLPTNFYRWARNISKKLPFSVDKKRGWGKIARLAESISGNMVETYPLRFSGFSLKMREALYDNSHLWNATENIWTDEILKLLHQTQSYEPFERLMALDQLTYLPEDILVKSDLAGMAFNLEARAPFLDYIFVEWINCLPLSYKVNKQSKRLLRDMMKDKLPQKILERKKTGFNPPIAEWIKTVLIEDLKLYLFSDSSPLRHFQSNVIKKMFDTHMSGNANLGESLWLLLVLAVWLEQYNIEL